MSEYEIDWKSIAVIIAPVSAAFAYILKKWYDNLSLKKEKQLTRKVLPVLGEINEILDDIVKNTSCNRSLLLKAHNGGGVPKIGSELFSTVVLEMHEDNSSVREAWTKQRLDSPYINVLVKLASSENGMILASKEDFKGSILYDVYTMQGVNSTKLAYITNTKADWFYISNTFASSLEEIKPEEKAYMRGQINKLRNLLNKNRHIL